MESKFKHIIVFESQSEEYQQLVLDFLKSIDLKPKLQAFIETPVE